MSDLRGIAYPEIWPNEIKPDGVLAIDFENEIENLKPVLLSFSWRSNGELKSVVYDCVKMNDKLRESVFDLLKKVKKVVAHNILHELKVLHYWGFETKYLEGKIEDTMIIQHCVNTEAEKSLTVLSKSLLDRELVSYKEASKVGGSIFIEYNRMDAISCLEIYEKISGWVHGWSVSTVYRMELEVVWWLLDAYVYGVFIDLDILNKLNEEFEQSLMQDEVAMLNLVGGVINLKSTQQLAKLLFDDWGINPNPKHTTAKGSRSVNVTALEWLRDYGKITDGQREFLKTLLVYRKNQKLQSTYTGDNFTKHIHLDGRLRTDIQSVMTKTGRESSSNPNLQNIPSKGYGKKIRQAFIASPGNDLIVADYSQVEYRLYAHFSNSKKLIDDFKSGRDFHQSTADLLSVPRSLAKVINFALFYGAGIDTFQLLVNTDLRNQGVDTISRSLAEKYHSMYSNSDDRKRLLSAVERQVKANKYIRTISGRIRRLDHVFENSIGKYALSTLIQGTAADIMKLAKIKLRKVLPKEAKMVLTVHDEILIDTPKELTEELILVIKDTMENVHRLSVPLIADPVVGHSWFDCK